MEVVKLVTLGAVSSPGAVNASTGNFAWEVPLGITDTLPEAKQHTGSQNSAGSIATAGGLVFVGTGSNIAGYFFAFDAKTGALLWKYNTGSGIIGSPITWEQDGEQYVAVMSGWGGAVPLWGGEVAKAVQHINQGGALWVFKLPKA